MKTRNLTLYKARRSLELTQQIVADRVGITQSFYSRIEWSDAYPSASVLSRICKILQVSADDVLSKSPVKPKDDVGDIVLRKKYASFL